MKYTVGIPGPSTYSRRTFLKRGGAESGTFDKGRLQRGESVSTVVQAN